MPQFYPDGPAAVSLNAIQESSGINTPPPEDFNTPGLQGSMQQILSENLGKFVIADFLIGVSTIVRRVGIVYSVGSGFVVLYLDEYKAFQVCDIFSLKFVTFYPPGSEPTLDEILHGGFGGGILNPGGSGGILSGGQGMSSGGFGVGSVGQNMNSGMGGSMSGRGNSGNSNSSGCRTLGQR